MAYGGNPLQSMAQVKEQVSAECVMQHTITIHGKSASCSPRTSTVACRSWQLQLIALHSVWISTLVLCSSPL
jgi:hypothetical protein